MSIQILDSRTRVLLFFETQKEKLAIADLFSVRGFNTMSTIYPNACVELAHGFTPDLVIVSGKAPPRLLDSIRGMVSTYAIALVSDEEEGRTRVFEGFDDYVVRTGYDTAMFEQIETIARTFRQLGGKVKAQVSKVEMKFGPIEINRGARIVEINGVSVNLTRIEYEIFLVLVASAGMVVTRRHIIKEAWGQDWIADEHVVDVHISNMRQKIRSLLGDKVVIETNRGVGYSFAVKNLT